MNLEKGGDWSFYNQFERRSNSREGKKSTRAPSRRPLLAAQRPGPAADVVEENGEVIQPEGRAQATTRPTGGTDMGSRTSASSHTLIPPLEQDIKRLMRWATQPTPDKPAGSPMKGAAVQPLPPPPRESVMGGTQRSIDEEVPPSI